MSKNKTFPTKSSTSDVARDSEPIRFLVGEYTATIHLDFEE